MRATVFFQSSSVLRCCSRNAGSWHCMQICSTNGLPAPSGKSFIVCPLAELKANDRNNGVTATNNRPDMGLKFSPEKVLRLHVFLHHLVVADCRSVVAGVDGAF